jgi:hypothetical protein
VEPLFSGVVVSHVVVLLFIAAENSDLADVRIQEPPDDEVAE